MAKPQAKAPARKTARAVRTVYLFTDLEGCAGVDDWDPRHHEYKSTAQYVHERSEMQRLLTAEVNACVEGCVDAGVSEVIVNDAHGAGRTIMIEELHPRARLIKGKKRPVWTFAMDRCDAVFHLGMHAISDTPGGTLCHTMSNSIKDFRLNGERVSEFHLSIFQAGYHGLPCPFFSGEMRACEQVRALVPGIVTVETKEGISAESALHRAPAVVRAEIREASARAVESARAGQVKPVLRKPPFLLEQENRAESFKPSDAAPFKRYINPWTIGFEAHDFNELMQWAFFNEPPKTGKPLRA